VLYVDLNAEHRYLAYARSICSPRSLLLMPTVAITGAAGAIGSVTAEVFADAGWDLALIDYGSDNKASLDASFPDAHVFDCDLTDEVDTHEVFRSIGQKAQLDAVLGIAGGFAMQSAEEATMDDYRHMVHMNFQTLFNTARAAWPVLTEQDRSFLLGVSAPAATDGQAGAALYGAAKGAVAGYVKSLDKEGREEGLRASVLYPMGVVDTPANREAMPDADPTTWIAPRELAEGMLHLATRSPRGHLRELKVHAAT
jgi:NADP-dependent 3-hydroxy acid dehydrogenase YdfG